MDFSDNPITKIDAFAFRDTPEVENLILTNIKLENYRGDLNFLKRMAALLDLNMSNCFVHEDFTDFENFPEVF